MSRGELRAPVSVFVIVLASGLLSAGSALVAAAVSAPRTPPGASFPVLIGASAGVAVALVAGALAAAVAGRCTARLSSLLAAATGAEARGGADLDALASAIDALRARVRLAEGLAERHRQSAEHARAGLAELLGGLVAAEEATRGQLAAELHDTVAQTLTLARRQLADALEDGDVEAAATAAETVFDAEEQLRAVLANTRPPALRDGDLAGALQAVRDNLAMRYAFRVDVEWPQRSYPIPLATAVIVYRFAQETLLNAVKHADVDGARLQLSVQQTGEQPDPDAPDPADHPESADHGGADVPLALVVEVHDDGPGFDLASVRSEHGRHVGLALLRERARLAGGRVEVESSPGLGTTLRLRLPLAVPAPQAEPLPLPPPAAMPPAA